MSKYTVTIPIAGHAIVEVHAESEAQAIEKAIESADREHIDEWETLEQFNEGNVCYCPMPWEVVVESHDE